MSLRNKYDGECRHCGAPVKARAGRARQIRGRWLTECLDWLECQARVDAKTDLAAEHLAAAGL